MSVEIVVRMGELAVSSQSDSVLTALGLGSCIALCGYDPVSKISGMAHIVLPASVGKADSSPAKSADIGVPNFIEEMKRAGANMRRVQIVLTGGAQLFNFKGADTHMDIGSRNIQAVTQLLKSNGYTPLTMDVGGSVGRTVKLATETGVITVRSAGNPDKVLATLGSEREPVFARAA